MDKKPKKKRLIKLIIMLSVFALTVAAITVAVLHKPSSVTVIRSVKSQNTITNKAENAQVHYAKSKSAFNKTVAESGLIQLCVDEISNSFGIIETGSKKLWSALPLLENIAEGEELSSDASMATLKILGGSDIYYLNTQDNSLEYKKASFKTVDNGAEFTFDIFPDSKTAAKKSYSKEDIGFRIVITVTLKDGSMLVDCKHSNLTGNPDACIESIDLLSSFGAYNDSLEDDFLLVPDGCGAIIKTSIYDESFESLSFSVYGSDTSIGNSSSGDAVIPAFGIKHGETAFVSLIEKGDATATIKAEKATSLTEYNRVYPSFLITPVRYENQKLYVSKKTAVDEISLCYRFLTGSNSTYAGLASACREQLIRNSVLSTKTVNVTDYLPCYLSLTAATSSETGPFRTLKPVTTFEQAADMLTHMKSKGINNVSIRYSGAFNGGVNSADISNLKLNNESGGKKALAELYEYTKSQKMNLYLDINLLSSSSGFGSNSVMNIRKDISLYNPTDVYSDYRGTEMKRRELRFVESLKDIVKSVVTDSGELAFSGFCINDAGSVLYSDFSKNGILRQDAADIISSSIAPLSTDKSTMAVTGNFYMIKNVDSIINMPMKTSASASGAYVSIPFVPLILHGIVDYTGEPINTQINIDETLLKYIEYGACPHFAWNYEPSSDNVEKDIYYYDNTINTASEYYTRANKTLNDLRDARMTDHYQVTDGIFCTEYDTGSMVYVNYTDNSYETLGVTVEARSFLRVN